MKRGGKITLKKYQIYLLGGLLFLVVSVLVIYNIIVETIVDYRFDAYGTVVAADGAPLSKVKVSLDISVPVYHVITPISSAATLTDDDGSFRFGYISHDSNPRYNLKFDSPG